MTDGQFPRLFSPIDLRSLRLKNRICLAPHGTGMTEGGTFGNDVLAYYEARVRNGVGLVVSEAHHVVPIPGQTYPNGCAATDDCIEPLRRMVELCEAHDCRFFGQLYHEGRARMNSLDGSRDVAVAPSALPDERFHIVPQEMTVAMIDEMVGATCTPSSSAPARTTAPTTTAARPRTDGGSWPKHWPPSARRSVTDRWSASGSCPRTGTPTACASRTRSRPAGRSPRPASATTSASRPAARTPSPGPATSCPPCSPRPGRHCRRPGRSARPCPSRSWPAVASTSPRTPSGRSPTDEIRACIACNQACIGHRPGGFPVSCIQHPETGRELAYGSRTPAATRRHVVVVGGGPGGMKAAAVAAERGHQVTLYERASRLGGQALLAEALPGRAEFGGIVTNLEREVRAAGVDVHTGVEATTDLLVEAAPEAVVLATGALPHRPDPAWFEGAHVVTAWEVIRGEAQPGRDVVVADWRCDWVGPGVAELLRIGHRCRVRLCVNGEAMGQSLQSYLRHELAGRLHREGVDVLPYLRLRGADADTVYLQHVMTEEPVLLEGVDTLVLAYGHRSETRLLDALDGRIAEVHAVGDCVNPRTAEEAVLEGLRVGSLL